MTMSMARPLKFNPLHAFAVVILSTSWEYATAFQTQAAQGAIGLPTKSIVRLSNQDKIDAMFGPRVDDGEDEVLFSDTERGGDSWGAPSTEDSHQVKKNKSMTRWGSLNPKVKARIVKEAQERAIRNKKKREPAADKKRRLYMQYKEMEKQSKREKFVIRETPISSPARISLSSFNPGDSLKGRVISLTNFGAYVDVGSEVDGLLHVSQITRDEFVSHPRQFLSPGMEVDVRVVRVSKELKKLQLTMLPEEILEEENVFNKFDIDEDEDDRIQLDEIEVDDELWGEIRRVTDYGAYVELGAVVRGFLHFMDHPLFGDLNGAKPNEIMAVGDRVRVWVMDVDTTQKRIKLTANRPPGLPGPRREILWV